MANVHAVDLALLVFRVAIGAVFIAHGVNHIIGGGKIAGTGRWFESLGMKPGWFHAWTASITEIGAGALLVLGLLTAFGGAGVVGVMVVAWVTNHLRNGFFIFRPGEGWEYVMVLTMSGLPAGHGGAGRVEHRQGRRPHLAVGVDGPVDRPHRRSGRGRPPAGHILAARAPHVTVGLRPVLRGLLRRPLRAVPPAPRRGPGPLQRAVRVLGAGPPRRRAGGQPRLADLHQHPRDRPLLPVARRGHDGRARDDDHAGPARPPPAPGPGVQGVPPPVDHGPRAHGHRGHQRLRRPSSRVGPPSTPVEDFAAPFPVEIISRMLGVPAGRQAEDPALDRPHPAA